MIPIAIVYRKYIVTHKYIGKFLLFNHMYSVLGLGMGAMRVWVQPPAAHTRHCWAISPALICFLSKSVKQEITRSNNFLLFQQGCRAALRDGMMASCSVAAGVLFLALFEIYVRMGMASPNGCTELMPSLREICRWAPGLVLLVAIIFVLRAIELNETF